MTGHPEPQWGELPEAVRVAIRDLIIAVGVSGGTGEPQASYLTRAILAHANACRTAGNDIGHAEGLAAGYREGSGDGDGYGDGYRLTLAAGKRDGYAYGHADALAAIDAAFLRLAVGGGAHEVRAYYQSVSVAVKGHVVDAYGTLGPDAAWTATRPNSGGIGVGEVGTATAAILAAAAADYKETDQ